MSKTFEFQEQLKTLPLSNLNDAGMNFLDWVEPLVTKEQFNTTKSNLENFMKKDGLILEKKLEEWSEQNKGNWLAPLWRDMYLDIRDPVVIDVNYFVKIITDHLKTKYSSAAIAGVIINKLMNTYESISKETYEPEKIRDTPICMAAYKQMFKATKIPKLNSDEYIVKSKTKTSHIIIMYKNHMFKLNLTDENGKRHSCKMIINTLNNLSNSNIKVNDTSMGLLTTATRDKAAILLEEIITIDKNDVNFEILKDALFMVCMDENSNSLEEFAMSLIGSNENNRYFDKNFQLIFDKNGNFGFNLEHTGADAGPWITIINSAYAELTHIDKYLEDESIENIRIEQLNWELPISIKTKLNKVRAQHTSKLEDLHQEIIYFKNFGSNTIKSWQVSPDAFLHLALQLAQYRTFNTLKSTYEAASTRAYLNGRTECSRPISMEVLEFVKAFDNQETDTSRLKELMGAATKKHSSRLKDCLGSNGVERYFFAMKNMYTLFGDELDLKEMPDFFNDDGYKQLTYSYISTSRIESKYFDLGGFGPVVPDGYGFWYNLIDERIDMNLITRKSVNSKYMKIFGNSIVKSLNDLAQLASK
jgi:carnitine O-acetyltransferase